MTATRVSRPVARDPRPSDTTIIAPLPRPAVAGPRSTVHSVPVPQPPSRADEPKESQPGVVQPGVVQPDAVQPDAAPVDAAPADAAPAVVFTMSASTGEAFTVDGSGLLGRRPIAQPGESVERFVSVADTGRSVSKTHLEFGIEAAELWICDRYSANGTVIVPPGGEPRMCEPGRRYRVQRGARIEIGDQYLDVS